jgi:hypothetical protein
VRGLKSMESNSCELYPSEHPPVKGHSPDPRGAAVRFGTPSANYLGEMIRRAGAIPVLMLAVSGSLFVARANFAIDRPQGQQPKTDSKEKADPKEQTASLTGCVDEQEGKWVLVSDQTMAIIATLAADGFPTEAFAKYMGHKVTVRGTASSTGSSAPFKVRTIDQISDTCAAR